MWLATMKLKRPVIKLSKASTCGFHKEMAMQADCMLLPPCLQTDLGGGSPDAHIELLRKTLAEIKEILAHLTCAGQRLDSKREVLVGERFIEIACNHTPVPNCT